MTRGGCKLKKESLEKSLTHIIRTWTRSGPTAAGFILLMAEESSSGKIGAL